MFMICLKRDALCSYARNAIYDPNLGLGSALTDSATRFDFKTFSSALKSLRALIRPVSNFRNTLIFEEPLKSVEEIRFLRSLNGTRRRRQRFTGSHLAYTNCDAFLSSLSLIKQPSA